jgi:predicted SnoaL-like aldol condensation-catalyzing enzyme
MSEQNKALLIRWFEEVWNQNRPETIDDLMDPKCVIHDGESDIRGPAEFHKFAAGLRTAFTDIEVGIHQTIAEGDFVMLRWSSSMKDRETGKPLRTTGFSLVRFADGRFAEAWQNWDRAGVTEQMMAARAAAC